MSAINSEALSWPPKGESLPLSTMADTQNCAQMLASRVRRGDVVTVSGNLGAGKTAFVGYVINALSAQPVEVTSPTFNLLQTYPVILQDATECEFYHYDLYRIEQISALYELGFDEALAGITFIEWPEKLGGMALPVSLAVSLTLGNDGIRRITFQSEDERWGKV